MSEIDETIPVPRPLLRQLFVMVGGIAVFLLVSTVHGLVVPDFDAWHQSVSALALAPHGWVQVVNFSILGCAILWTVPTWRRVLHGGHGAKSFPVFATALGVAFLLVGCFPQDPAPGYDPAGLELDAPTLIGLLHLGVAGVAAVSSTALMLIVASRVSGDAHWKSWTAYTRVMAGLTVGCVVVYGLWSTSDSGFAGTFERAAIAIPGVWAASFLRMLWIGRPFIGHAAR